MKTSQSAVARIESGQENITLDTLQRLIAALNGRFAVSIHPQEYALPQKRPWWELTAMTPWTIVGLAARRGIETDQVLLGLERAHGQNLGAVNTLGPGAGLLAEANTSA